MKKFFFLKVPQSCLWPSAGGIARRGAEQMVFEGTSLQRARGPSLLKPFQTGEQNGAIQHQATPLPSAAVLVSPLFTPPSLPIASAKSYI